MASGASELTPARASSILARVSYRDRLRVGRLRWPSGYLPTPVRSLHEVHITLMTDDKSLPAIHFPTLAEWVESVIGDPDFARTVEACGSSNASYADQCRELLALLGERLEHLREVADEPDF